MAEVLFRKKKLGRILRAMGGIYVDRESSNFGFVAESEHILQKGGVVGIFPESRLPRADFISSSLLQEAPTSADTLSASFSIA